MYVKDWMSAPAITIEPGVCLEEAWDLMAKKGIRRLPVVRDGRLVGIVTRSDIESDIGRTPGETLPGTRRALKQTVERVMTPEPATVSPDETLERAASLMLNRRVSGLPVVDAGVVVGMITETDAFRALVDMLGFSDGGARVVLPLHTPDTLGNWMGKLRKGVVIRTLVTYHDPSTRQWKAVVRLRGRRPAPVKTT